MAPALVKAEPQAVPSCEPGAVFGAKGAGQGSPRSGRRGQVSAESALEQQISLMLYRLPQSLANVLTHLVFSTKNRYPFLADKATRQRTHAYLAAVLKDLLKTQGVGNFSWQRGYGAFSISQSQVAEVISYLKSKKSTTGK